MDYPPTCNGLPPKPPRRLIEVPPRWLALAAGLGFALAFPALAQVQPLSPDKAFLFSARVLDAKTVEARFTIADGYFLYRDKIHFAVEPASAAALATPVLPAGKVKQDQFFGRVETYRGSMTVKLAMSNFTPGRPLIIRAESQGCADIGICYPPTIQTATVVLPAGSVVPAAGGEAKKTWFN